MQASSYHGYLLKIGAFPVEVYDMRSKFATMCLSTGRRLSTKR